MGVRQLKGCSKVRQSGDPVGQCATTAQREDIHGSTHPEHLFAVGRSILRRVECDQVNVMTELREGPNPVIGSHSYGSGDVRAEEQDTHISTTARIRTGAKASLHSHAGIAVSISKPTG